MKAVHNIEFVIDEDVAIRVLYAISEMFCCPSIGTDENGEAFFNIYLTREQAINFYDLYGWTLVEICDMDQDDGGAFI